MKMTDSKHYPAKRTFPGSTSSEPSAGGDAPDPQLQALFRTLAENDRKAMPAAMAGRLEALIDREFAARARRRRLRLLTACCAAAACAAVLLTTGLLRPDAGKMRPETVLLADTCPDAQTACAEINRAVGLIREKWQLGLQIAGEEMQPAGRGRIRKQLESTENTLRKCLTATGLTARTSAPNDENSKKNFKSSQQ